MKEDILNRYVCYLSIYILQVYKIWINLRLKAKAIWVYCHSGSSKFIFKTTEFLKIYLFSFTGIFDTRNIERYVIRWRLYSCPESLEGQRSTAINKRRKETKAKNSWHSRSASISRKNHRRKIFDEKTYRNISNQCWSLLQSRWFSVGICKYKPSCKLHDLL